MKLRIIQEKLANLKIILLIYIAITLIVSLVEIAKGEKEFGGRLYPHYNNYLIFSKSFFHLINGKDLYVPFPDEHWDLFKYSPTFALIMGFFAIFPDYIGLIFWNLLNSLILFFAIKSIKFLNEKRKAYILWFILIDIVTSMQNSQSNGLVAGLLILAFNFFEKEKVHLSSLFILLSLFVKPIGFVALLLFLLYPKRIKFIYSSIIFGVILALLSLFVVSPSQLYSLYKSWANLILRDYSVYEGLSVFGILKNWFGLNPPKHLIFLSGLILFALPFLRRESFKNYTFRLLFFSSSLIWTVIFNHKAESPTFIIATCGVAIWYFSKEKKLQDLILLIFYFLLTSVSSTDITPFWVKENLIKPYLLKAIPSIILWLKIEQELIFSKVNSKRN